jgi:hypothetical protein
MESPCTASLKDARRRQGVEGRPVISFDAADRDRQSSIVREELPKT